MNKIQPFFHVLAQFFQNPGRIDCFFGMKPLNFKYSGIFTKASGPPWMNKKPQYAA